MRVELDLTVMNRQDDLLFATFSRDLARRRRRPGLYGRAPSVIADALEQLCGGGTVTIPPAPITAALPDDFSVTDFED